MAFGFFATDFEKSTVEVTFQSRNGDSITRVIPYNQNCPNGSVVFYGVIDPQHPFTKVIFRNTLNEQQYLYDWFGFDDFTIQPVPTPTPTPTMTPTPLPPITPTPTPTSTPTPKPTEPPAPDITPEPPNPPSSVPEPTTAILVGIGLLAGLFLTKRSIKK